MITFLNFSMVIIAIPSSWVPCMTAVSLIVGDESSPEFERLSV